ncbi:PVC-type heme-binding CxxCH protein [Rubripirellula reticaptiva]|uniref:Cytochrome c n=1 Tax=Rubripirellula reticaptiva TaxID=2528013 RepID=A0A5C6FCJ8_9BACT|nr:PVC-type heme-binding CxxCH protein [Rubripirellula reticaptiva]TWU58357.1 Cytochrome c [Rubripirellula reticaptiva]
MMRSAWVLFTFLLVIGGNSLSRAVDVDYGSELPRVSPREPTAALASFAVADGFEIQLVAAEPLVASPVAIEWDASGAMFVCEMRGYSENRDDGISRIAKLTDNDGDGVYDSRTTYADGLNWPTGLFPFDGGLFVGDAPDLWYLKDTDGDGVSDVKQRVLTGFGTSNVQGLMNSFRWGLDNRIHIACSSVGGDIRTGHATNDSPSINIRGRDIALDPRTYVFEPTSGAAQHGMGFDDWGRKFVSSNSDHIQQVMFEDRYIARNPYVIPPPSRISIASDGPQAEVFRTSPVEPWRILRTRLRVSGQAKGPIEGGGRAAGYFTGATGVTIYRGDAWPEQWKGTAIVGDVGSNLIHRKQLQQDGLEFIAQRIDQQSEFVTSTDIWFRPAQFANAPDGTLHVVDVYREVIEHPLSLPEEIKKHLDLTSGRDRGRIYRLAAKDRAPRPPASLQAMSISELVQTLKHDNAWHRETAARLLYERQDQAAAKPLRQLAGESASPLGRMHALYALSGLAALDEASLLRALRDTDPQVRRHAVRLIDTIAVTDELTDALLRLADDTSIEVRYQLAFTLGAWPRDRKVEALARIAKQNPSNRWITAAVLNAVGSEARQLKTSLAGELPELTKRLDEQISIRSRVTDSRSGGDTHPKPQPVVNRSAETKAQRQAVLARYDGVLTLPVDLERGSEQFKKHCSGCHRVDGIGFEIGPNLATIKSRGAETVLTSVLDPNREVNPQYINHVIVTTDGRVLSGTIVDEGATSVTLRRAENVTESVLRIEIDQMKSTGLSIMPEGFENSIDRQAMADLIGYLMQAP